MNEEQEKDDELIVLKVNGNQVFLGFDEDHDYIVSVLSSVITEMLKQDDDTAYKVFSEALYNVFEDEEFRKYEEDFVQKLFIKDMKKLKDKLSALKEGEQAALAHMLMNIKEQ